MAALRLNPLDTAWLTRKLGPKKLGMAFRGNLHRITDADYAAIERLMRERVPSQHPA